MVVCHLGPEGVNLTLDFSALKVSVSESESVSAEKGEKDKVHPRIVHPVVRSAVHCGHHRHRVSVALSEHRSREDVIVAPVATIDFVNHFAHDEICC